MVLEVDPEKRRISLGLKQCLGNPWEAFVEQHPVGAIIEGEIRNITEFGLFVGLDHDIDGMVHLSDLDWAAAGRGSGQEVQQGRHGPRPGARRRRREGADLAGHQAARRGPVQGGDLGHQEGRPRHLHGQGGQLPAASRSRPPAGPPGFIRKVELARDRDEQRPERFAPGEKIDAKVMSVDPTSRRLTLSVKALEIEDEKQAMAEFGSSDSGASLGDILGAAFRQKQEEHTKS